MQASQYAKAVPAILAEMGQERQDNDTPPPDSGEEAAQKMFVYRTDTGGWLISPTKIQEGEPGEEDEQPEPPIVDNRELETDARPPAKKEPAYFLHFLLILLLFVALDSFDALFVSFAPTVTITLTPVVQTVYATGSVSVGSGADIEGHILPPLTVSQEQTVSATGRGHQDAQAATGTLIYFNGAFAPQTVDAGTVYTGADGVEVATDATVTIPAATPGNPPQFGKATVTAHAVQAGAGGNIRAGDIAVTGSALQVSNSQFQGGMDARDFTYVTKADIDRPAAMLKAQVVQSMQAALGQQLAPGEQLQQAPCAHAVAADPAIGQEASQVRITVSETCSGFAYNSQQLTARGEKLLTAQSARTLGNGYRRYGDVSVTVTKAAIKGQTAILTFTCQGTWVYQINEARIEALVNGKPRLAALRLLMRFPGIERASVGGIADNQELPTDVTHIHVLILFPTV
jgi:hypothetical protein